MNDELIIPGLNRWLPLDLDADPENYLQQLSSEFAATPGIEYVSAGVVGMAQQMARARAAADEAGDSVLVAAWLFLPSETDLTPLAHATLTGLFLDPGEQTPELACDWILREEKEIFGEPEIREIQTNSGPATFFRYRPVNREDGEREVSEATCVFWLRPAQSIMVMLRCYATDLLEAADAPDALEALALGIQGL